MCSLDALVCVGSSKEPASMASAPQIRFCGEAEGSWGVVWFWALPCVVSFCVSSGLEVEGSIPVGLPSWPWHFSRAICSAGGRPWGPEGWQGFWSIASWLGIPFPPGRCRCGGSNVSCDWETGSGWVGPSRGVAVAALFGFTTFGLPALLRSAAV